MGADEADPILEKVDPAKRSFVRGIVNGTAFVAPVVASFSLDGLTIGDARAQILSNATFG